jgi:hypothetical protein
MISYLPNHNLEHAFYKGDGDIISGGFPIKKLLNLGNTTGGNNGALDNLERLNNLSIPLGLVNIHRVREPILLNLDGENKEEFVNNNCDFLHDDKFDILFYSVSTGSRPRKNNTNKRTNNIPNASKASKYTKRKTVKRYSRTRK